jgi:hypothetical protein
MRTNLLLVLADVPITKLAVICDFEVGDFSDFLQYKKII